MRGKDVQLLFLSEGFGITPAYAGKSRPFLFVTTNFRDHPRVCGEKPMVRAGLFRATGSPPRMRGKDAPCYMHAGCVGITPAYAGKSRTLGIAGSGKKDHPRVCGEKYEAAETTVDKVGITPAYAGKRRCGACQSCGRKDHPRVCGEKQLPC